MNRWFKFTGSVCLMAAMLAMSQLVYADDAPSAQITFTKNVLPILQQNCQVCHRQAGANLGGTIAPMSLVTYEEVRPWAKSIAKEVTARNMPPWDAAPQFHGVFANERTLNEKEIATIENWVKSGALKGDDKDAPAPVKFSTDEWVFGQPDLVLEMPKEFTVKDDVEDQYINFTVDIPENLLPEDRWIKGLQFKPGSPVVHHIIGYAVPQGVRADTDRGMIGGIAPGNDADYYPEGYGFRLAKGSKFIFAMHYHKEKGAGTAVNDLSRVAFKFFPKGEKVKPLHTDPVGNHEFEIPPGQANWEVGMARTLEKPITVLDLMPHMHLRGKAARYVAYYPDGKAETLLDVPAWDFNWQTSYEFKQPKKLPAGTRLEVSMWFDNSTGNKANPDPNKAVRFGGPTTDEMALGWLTYTVDDEAPTAKPEPQISSAGAGE